MSREQRIAEIEAELKRRRIAEIEAELATRQGAPSDFDQLKSARQQEVIDEMTGPEKFLTGIGRGYMDVVEGVKQLAGGDVSNVPEDLKRYEALAEDSPIAAGAGRVVGNIAVAPVPGGVGANVGTRLATAAAGSGLTQGLMYTPEDESRAQNMLKAAATGAIGQGVIGEPLRRGANKLANAKAGNMDVTDDAAKAIDFADSQGVPLYADDVTQSRGLKVLGDFTDDTPLIGTAGTRRKQGEMAQSAAESVRDKYAPTESLDDLSDTLVGSMKNKLKATKQQASKLYNKAFKELNEVGEFEMPGFRGAVAAIKANEDELGGLADAGLLKELQKLDAAPAGNFEHWHRIRSRLGSTVRDARKGEAVSTEATYALEKAKRALDDELAAVAQQAGGKGANAWRRADKFYKNSVSVFRRGVLKRALNEDNPEAVVDMLIGAAQRGTGRDSKFMANRLYNGLDREGKEAARYAMIGKAMDIATTEGKPFKPAQFAKALEGMEKRTGVFFNKADNQLLDGMKTYMRFAETAGHHLANQPTGRRLVPTLALAGGLFNSTAGAGLLATNAASRLMLRTKRGRDILMALGKTTPESKAGADAISAMTAYLVRGGALQRPEAETPDNPEELPPGAQ